MSRSPRRPGLFQEEDRVSGIGILLVLLATALLTAGGIWWAIGLGRPAGGYDGQRSPPRTEEVRNQEAVGNVRVTLIGVDSSARSLREARRAGLDGWRWIDADSGWVEIPIEAAMAVVAEATRGRPTLGDAVVEADSAGGAP